MQVLGEYPWGSGGGAPCEFVFNINVILVLRAKCIVSVKCGGAVRKWGAPSFPPSLSHSLPPFLRLCVSTVFSIEYVLYYMVSAVFSIECVLYSVR
jgi:hypothetical protein